MCVLFFFFFFFPKLSLCIYVYLILLSESLMHALVWPSVLVWAVMCVSGQPCQPDEFECLTGECVSGKYVCDFTRECSDGSDESNCKY